MPVHRIASIALSVSVLIGPPAHAAFDSVAIPPELPLVDSCPELDGASFNGSVEDLARRCRFFKNLRRRGLRAGAPMETEILGELLRPYANVIEINGDIPLAKPVLDYLLQELPDTTKLVNHFKKTDYRVYFIKSDRSAFYATNGRKMHATIAYIDKVESPAHSNYLMFEDGRAEILLWLFAGKSVVEIQLDERGQATDFGIRLHFFSNSHNFHLFFKSALFKSIVRSMFKRFIDDIVRATRRFAKAEEDYVADNPKFIEGLKQRMH